jgi:hypothetical protein
VPSSQAALVSLRLSLLTRQPCSLLRFRLATVDLMSPGTNLSESNGLEAGARLLIVD